MDNYTLITALLACLECNVNSLVFHLQPNERRCWKEEIDKDVLVRGEYTLSDAPGQKTQLIITDTKGRKLVSREDIKKGRYAFRTDDRDVIETCLISKTPAGQRGMVRQVTLVTKYGDIAQNYGNVAEVGKLKPLEVELQRLEDLSEYIAKYKRQREEELRGKNVAISIGGALQAAPTSTKSPTIENASSSSSTEPVMTTKSNRSTAEESPNSGTGNHERQHSSPSSPQKQSSDSLEFETDATKNLSTAQLQRLVLLEQLTMFRMTKQRLLETGNMT